MTAIHTLTLVVLLSASLAGQESRPTSAPSVADDGGKKKWSVLEENVPHRDLSFVTEEGTWMNVDVSPDGAELVFDLLGDIYLLPIAGGEARRVRGGLSFDVQPRFSPDGGRISFTSDAGGGDNIWVMDRDGGNARAVTSESFRLLNNAVWTPDGDHLVARKHFTSRRSLGAGEMWLYHVGGGTGRQMTARRTQQKDTGEPCVSPDGRYVYYSDDVTPGDRFEYNKDPHGTIYAIKRLDRETGEIRTVVGGPGGAVRPQVSPDGRTLAFVRRVRFDTVLCLMDLDSGDVRRLYSELSPDQQETWSIFGVYPGFSWTPDGAGIVIWAGGRLRRIDAETGEATTIPFKAKVDLRVAQTLRTRAPIGGEDFFVHVTRWPSVAPDGRHVVYTALGQTWLKELPDGRPERLTGISAREYAPAFSPDGGSVVQVVWDDHAKGRVVVVRLSDRSVRTITNEPGHYAEPRFSPDGTKVVFRRTAGDGVRGRERHDDGGIYVASAAGGQARRVTRRGRDPRFTPDGERLIVLRRGPAGLAAVGLDLHGGDEVTLAGGKYATDIVFSPDMRHVAFTHLFQAYVARFAPTGREMKLAPGTKAYPVKKLSRDAGEFLSFSADGRKVRWLLAHELMEANLDDVFAANEDEKSAAGAGEGGDSPAPLREGSRASAIHELGFTAASDVPPTHVVFDHVRAVTMKGDEILDDARIVVKGNRIVAVGPRGKVDVPAGATVMDLEGMVVLPGFVDVHSHMSRASLGMSPQSSWPLLANLAFGVTTVHDPSADTKMVFSESEMVRAGAMTGPRIFSTGTILYGAEAGFKAVIDSYDDAASHLRRLKAHGAFSVKSYNQPRRDQRQQVIKAALDLGMNVVPEGGSTLFHNLSEIVDGHTTIEHALPVAPLYDDVLTLFAGSGTAYTPTLVVGYGGVWGENYWYQKTPVWKHERLLGFVPRSVVEPRAMRPPMFPEEDFHHLRLAKGVAEIVRRGGLAELGAHGQMQGLAAHWEMWMFAQGGLDAHQVLQAATRMGARAIGLDGDIGTIDRGKLADLVFYPPSLSPLKSIRNSEKLVWVMKNGRLYEAATLDQLLPARVERRPGPPVGAFVDVPAAGRLCLCH